MKALACGGCGDIRALGHAGGPCDWVSCSCGLTVARWVDPQRGMAEFRDPGAGLRTYCFLLGLNNRVLSPALAGQLSEFADFRTAHKEATRAPGYIFDSSRAGCWAVIVPAGSTSDVTWAADWPPPPPEPAKRAKPTLLEED